MNEGNKRYRDLVKERRPEYLATGKRHKKDQIAREIVEVITNDRKGRFVRKVESLIEAEELGVPEGVTAWALVPLDAVLLKVKQALRGRRADGSGDGDDDEDDSEQDEGKANSVYGASTGDIHAAHFTAGEHPRALAAATHTLGQAGRPTAVPLFLPGEAMHYPPLSQHSFRRPGSTQHFAAAPNAGLLTYSQPPTLMLPNVTANVPTFSSGHTTKSLSSVIVGGQQPILLPSRANLDLRSLGLVQSPYGRVIDPTATVMRSHRLPTDSSVPAALDAGGPANLGRGIEECALVPTGNARGPANLGRSIEDCAVATTENESETRGDASIRTAYLRAGQPPQGRELFLELSLLEVQLLCVMCSHGIPSWTTRDATVAHEPDDSSSGSRDSYSWNGFAALLQDVSSEWDGCEMHRQRRASTSQDAALTRILRATRKQVSKLVHDPVELSKRAVALLECLVRLSKASVTDVSTADAGLEAWLGQELCRWAASLELVGEQGRPVACCTQTLLSDADLLAASGQDAMTHMASFDRGNTRDVVAQVSCITRLRDIVERAESRSASYLVSRIAAAAADSLEAKQVWHRRPGWWGKSTTNPVEHDVQLLKKLAEEGFRGVLQDDGSNYRTLVSGGSMWKLLSKAAVEERARQLLGFLHARQESEDQATIFRDRRRRLLADLGLPSSQMQQSAERDSNSSGGKRRRLS